MLELGKFSLGMGDRFAHQAAAQLRACMMAAEQGVTLVPVWNKSNREHATIGSEPNSVRAAADAAVKKVGWQGAYHVDADHINLGTVDRFIESSDFFTIDVASSIGKEEDESSIAEFVAKHGELAGEIRIPGLEKPFRMEKGDIQRIAAKYLLAVGEAGRIYRHIAARKGHDRFITEISMDETDAPQTPPELLIILAAIADDGVPVQTIAPKFTGRFNKGVDYVGDVRQFEQEFSDDVAVIAHAVKEYDLPENLKLSVHSGSDKFSIYSPMRRVLRSSGAGLHIKTAGTTWLEEVIGLAEGGGEGLEIAKEIYAESLKHRNELCAPYATVIDIRAGRLPTASEVQRWNSAQFTAALRHDRANAGFNPDLRQLLHVGYKVAANLGTRYSGALKSFEESVSKNVTENLFKRHIQPLFL